MVENLLIVIAGLVVACLVLLVVLIIRNPGKGEAQLMRRFEALQKDSGDFGKEIKCEIARGRDEANSNAKKGREEILGSFKLLNDMTRNQLDSFSMQLKGLTQSNEQKHENLRRAVDDNLKMMRDDNSEKLEKIRVAVDEKLHTALEKRLGDSFKLVSERLELVHKGLGEMQLLAAGVGDLKKALTNIKTRGVWGEIQLGALLDQILTCDQYAQNVAVKKGSDERVEFAIRLPGNEGSEGVVWLPIDAKFPKEDYERLIDARERGDQTTAEEALKQLELRIKAEAKKINDKYICPPETTDFAIMFLPFESLYSEALRRPGICEHLQRDYRVVITGPSSLGALLNSLQMGFRTLAIEKRSSEVWALLGAVKTEFVRFGDILDKTQKKLQEAGNTIETAARRSRAIERKLKNVESLPYNEQENAIDEG